MKNKKGLKQCLSCNKHYKNVSNKCNTSSTLSVDLYLFSLYYFCVLLGNTFCLHFFSIPVVFYMLSNGFLC